MPPNRHWHRRSIYIVVFVLAACGVSARMADRTTLHLAGGRVCATNFWNVLKLVLHVSKDNVLLMAV